MERGSQVLSRLAFSARQGCVTAIMRSSLLNGHILCIGNTPRVMLTGDGQITVSKACGPMRRYGTNVRGRLLSCRGRTVHALKFTCRVLRSKRSTAFFIGKQLRGASLACLNVITVSSPIHTSIPTTIRDYLSTNVSVGVIANSAPKATGRVKQRVKA